MDGEHPPLHTKVCVSKITKYVYVYRALALLRIGATCLLLKYRLAHPLNDAFAIWFLAISCEVLFTLNLLLYSICRWRPIERAICLHSLSSRYERSGEPSKLQPVDIFITSADPLKEPPIVTANTILSVLAADYPVEKISCYVSDDSGSPITFCMMLEVSHFAHKWVTFCNNFSIEPRAPGPFFSNPYILHEGVAVTSDSYLDQWKSLKDEYEQFKYRIKSLTSSPEQALKRAREYVPSWTSPNPSDHPAVVEVILPNENEMQISGHEKSQRLPPLVYVAREKRHGNNHRFKAGALNALMRVSAILSNSPFILNLDCDMYINDSKALRYAMCFLMDTNLEDSVAFVQFPQVFDNLGAKDVYGNRLVFLYDVLVKGFDGIQGPHYYGTGCVHRRKTLYGCKPGNSLQHQGITGHSGRYEEYRAKVGPSSELIESALASASHGSAQAKTAENPTASTEALLDLCSSSYEHNTSWGTEIGWKYGSNSEDVLTGLHIHCLGWRSIYFCPSRPAFRGIAPTVLTDRLAQRKRVSCGLAEIFFSRHSPLLYGHKGLTLPQRASYIYLTFFYTGVSIFIILYAALHAACLLCGRTRLVPEITDPAIIWFVLAICFQHGMNLLEYRWVDVSFGEWWNQERFWYISTVSAFLFGTVEAFMKSTGIIETGFTVTPKSETQEDENSGSYQMADSPLFIPPTTLVMVFVVALLAATVRVVKGGIETFNNMFGELSCGLWWVVMAYPILPPFYKLPKGIAAVPVSVMLPSVIITTIFCVFVGRYAC